MWFGVSFHLVWSRRKEPHRKYGQSRSLIKGRKKGDRDLEIDGVHNGVSRNGISRDRGAGPSL